MQAFHLRRRCVLAARPPGLKAEVLHAQGVRQEDRPGLKGEEKVFFIFYDNVWETCCILFYFRDQYRDSFLDLNHARWPSRPKGVWCSNLETGSQPLGLSRKCLFLFPMLDPLESRRGRNKEAINTSNFALKMPFKKRNRISLIYVGAGGGVRTRNHLQHGRGMRYPTCV